MPQLDPSGFLPQLIWLALTFIVLYLLMAKLALPRVSDVLEDRSRRREDDLGKAESLQAEAEAISQAYEASLAEARDKAQARILAIQESMRIETDRKLRESDASVAARLAAEESVIHEATREALDEAVIVAGELARLASNRIAGLTVDEDRALGAAREAREARAT